MINWLKRLTPSILVDLWKKQTKKQTKKQKKTDCDANISDVEGKIPSIADLATNADFNAV